MIATRYLCVMPFIFLAAFFVSARSAAEISLVTSFGFAIDADSLLNVLVIGLYRSVAIFPFWMLIGLWKINFEVSRAFALGQRLAKWWAKSRRLIDDRNGGQS